MNKNPLVSIIIPVYSGSDYLGEAIDSALAQTYDNIEIIVVNDGSTDDGATRRVAQSYGNKIKYFEKDNGGVASAFNYGISKMNGDFFAWLSHDDVYYPNKTEIQIKFLKNNKYLMEDVILYSDLDYMNEKSEITGKRELENIPPDKFRRYLLTSYPVNGNTVLIPKKCFDHIGVFREDLKSSQDYDLWFRLSKKYRFVHIPEKLVKSRRHSKQGSKNISTFFEEGISTKINNINGYSESELIELFLEKEIYIVYKKLAFNYAFRGGDKVGLPLKFVFAKYKKSILNKSFLLNWHLRLMQ